jgi:polysaccharide export outer membrane protein
MLPKFMHQLSKKFLMPVVLLLGIVSCKTRKELVYFQKESQDSLVFSNYTPVFKTDDFLAVLITSDDPEAAVPFNFPVGTQQNFNNGYTIGNPATVGYLVDSNGEIKLPVIGAVKVAGLSRMEVTMLIESKLKEYIKNPVVNIQIQNYKITVLGDVRNPGTYKIPNERMTILEAIGLAGDLRMTGNRKNVLVIRDENGKKTEYRIDLTSKDLFSSAVYYLTQNDVIYVEPNATARSESTLWRTAGPIFISLTSLVVTTFTLLFR